jgi:hypothetical protein
LRSGTDWEPLNEVVRACLDPDPVRRPTAAAAVATVQAALSRLDQQAGADHDEKS